MADNIQVKTTPIDRRFPNTNQTKNCWVQYNDYHNCVKAKGDDAQECLKYKKAFHSICPIEWTETWDDQRANGVFPGPAN